jgi:hypothetical protein
MRAICGHTASPYLKTYSYAARISEKFKRWIAEPEKAVNLDLL